MNILSQAGCLTRWVRSGSEGTRKAVSGIRPDILGYSTLSLILSFCMPLYHQRINTENAISLYSEQLEKTSLEWLGLCLPVTGQPRFWRGVYQDSFSKTIKIPAKPFTSRGSCLSGY
jgi:hypothetical protein